MFLDSKTSDEEKQEWIAIYFAYTICHCKSFLYISLSNVYYDHGYCFAFFLSRGYHGLEYTANTYIMRFNQCSFQHTILLSGHEKKNLSISTWGSNLKIADMVDILSHEGGVKKEPIFHSAVLTRLKFKKIAILKKYDAECN